MSGLAARLLGDFEYLLAGDRAAVNIARALPEIDGRQRRAILRRSFRLRARRRLDRWRTLDDRALCRRLTLEGFEHLHAARAARGTVLGSSVLGLSSGLGLSSVLGLSSALGEPRLAERVLRLYAGDPQAALRLLPAPCDTSQPSMTCTATFLGQELQCSTGPAGAALHDSAALLPIFGLFVAGGRYRVRFAEPILPQGNDAAALTRRTLAAIEAAVKAEPESWPWMNALHHTVSSRTPDTARMLG